MRISPGRENPDIMCWQPEAKGIFTAKSAYEIYWEEEELEAKCPKWDKVWQQKGPQRGRTSRLHKPPTLGC